MKGSAVAGNYFSFERKSMKKVLVVFVASACAHAFAGSGLYGIMFRTGGQTSGLNPKLYDINPATGAATNPRNVNVNDCVGIAIDPLTGTMYGMTDQFGRINNQSGQGGKNLLFSINPATGAATGIGRIDPTGAFQEFEGDMAFEPGTNALWGITTNVNSAALYTINKTTGLATQRSIFSLGGDLLDASAMAFGKDGSLYILDTRYPSTGQGGPARLFKVNANTGSVLQSWQTTALLGNCAGMTFNPNNGDLLVADGDTYGTANLYKFNFGTGDLNVIGATGVSGGTTTVYTGLSGLAAVPEPGTVAALLLGAGALLARRRR